MALKRARFYFKFAFVVVIAPRCLWEGTTMADGLGMLRRYDSVSVGPDVQGPLGNQQWSVFRGWLVWRDGYIFPFILESRIVCYDHQVMGNSFQSTNISTWTTLSPMECTCCSQLQLLQHTATAADHIPKDVSKRTSCKNWRMFDVRQLCSTFKHKHHPYFDVCCIIYPLGLPSGQELTPNIITFNSTISALEKGKQVRPPRSTVHSRGIGLTQSPCPESNFNARSRTWHPSIM